jgi:hypothetical protein
LLLLILFYVFPLRFIMGALFDGFTGQGWAFSFEQGNTLMAVYSLGFAAVFGMFALMYRHAYRLRDELELNALELVITQGSMRANVILMIMGLLSASLALLGPWWMVPFAGIMYSFIGPVMWWHWKHVQRDIDRVTPAQAA